MSIRQGNRIIANKTVPAVYTAGPGITIDNQVIKSKIKYTFEMGVPSATWEIQHNLNDFPSVTVVDSAGTIFDCKVTYINENKCVVKMNIPITGKAYLN